MSDTLGTVLGVVLLLATVSGLWGWFRRSRRFLRDLRIANENRNKAKAAARSDARSGAAAHAAGGSVVVNLGRGAGGGDDDLDDVERALVHYVIGAHRAGLISDDEYDGIRAAAGDDDLDQLAERAGSGARELVIDARLADDARRPGGGTLGDRLRAVRPGGDGDVGPDQVTA